MNEIPPVPKGSNVGPKIFDEDAPPVRFPRPGLEIEDMTPPMRSDEQDQPPRINEPRLIAQAADSARNVLMREMDQITKQIDTLTERVKEIEKFIQDIPSPAMPPASPPASPSAQPIDVPEQEFRGAGHPGAMQLSESGGVTKIEKVARDIIIQTDAVADPDVQAATYKAQPHSVAEEVREIEFRRPIENVERVPEATSSTPLAVAGTPGLYMGIFLRGYKKNSADEDWVPMTVEEEIAATEWKREEDVIGTEYPWSNVLRPTWDWPRVQP